MSNIESTPFLNNKTEIKLSSPPSSFIFNENSEKRPYFFEKQKNNICIDENISSEDCANIIDSNFIPKLNLDSCKRVTNTNTNVLLEEKVKNNNANRIDGGNSEHLIISNINISNNGSKINIKNESEIDSKNKEKEKEIDKKVDKDKVLKTSNNITNYKSNVKQNRVLNKSNSNNNYGIISFKNKNSSSNNITSYKIISTEGNIRNNIRSSKKNRSNSKILSSKSKNKYQNIKRINCSLSNNKSKVKKKENKYKVIQIQSNRNKTTENSNYKCKNNNLHIKVKEIYRSKNENQKEKEKEKEKKEEIDFESPEEMHYFMVNLTINYRLLNENF
jgi:hypothetical protein